MTAPPRARTLGLVRCHGCGLACEATAGPHDSHPLRCPRCHSALHLRRVDGLTRCAALLLAGIILYVPANLLPVMYTGMLGKGSDSTIMEGVVEFWLAGSWGIALVIFIASVAVPCTKFLVLGLLVVTARRRSTWAQLERARLYRLVELIGYWSMLDVLVVAVVAALVQFQPLSEVEPRIGIAWFGAVVIVTMLSAMSFDPRLIWDADDK